MKRVNLDYIFGVAGVIVAAYTVYKYIRDGKKAIK
jgi:hypothetical protein